MAGPAIRYYNFARELAHNFDVTLMVPGPVDIEIDGFEVVQAQDYGGRAFRPYARSFEVLVAQNLLPWTMRALARDPVRVIYDLYDPFLVENLGLFAEQEGSRRYQDAILRANALAQEVALKTGDAFLCASERQRDLWLGMLGTLGRLDRKQFARDPSLRALIDIVPFGLQAEPPAKTRAVLKGVVPGIGERVNALCSADGEQWFTVGYVDFPVTDPVQVGMHAIGMIDRAVDVPQCLPSRMARMNMSSVQMPRPVFLSGVRFIA